MVVVIAISYDSLYTILYSEFFNIFVQEKIIYGYGLLPPLELIINFNLIFKAIFFNIFGMTYELSEFYG